MLQRLLAIAVYTSLTVALATAESWAGVGGGFQLGIGPATPVAEPASFAVLAVGAAAILGLRRRRNRK